MFCDCKQKIEELNKRIIRLEETKWDAEKVYYDVRDKIFNHTNPPVQFIGAVVDSINHLQLKK